MVQSRVAGFTHEQQEDLAKVIKAVSAQAVLPYQAEADEADQAEIMEGAALISSASVGCTECHEFQDVVEQPLGPTLTGFGSEEWLTAFIRDASHPRFYGDRNDRMPAFGPEEILTDEEIRLLVDWLREDWHRSGEGEGPR